MLPKDPSELAIRCQILLTGSFFPSYNALGRVIGTTPANHCCFLLSRLDRWRIEKLDICKIASLFDIEGVFLSAVPYGSGHINDTYLAIYRTSGIETQYIHQRINSRVFQEPESVIENFDQITSHIAEVLQESGIDDIERRVLSLVKARSGRNFANDDEGDVWRTAWCSGSTSTHDIVASKSLAYEVGRCYGEFQNQLMTLDPTKLHTTIADFHNTRRRFDQVQEAIISDPSNRAVRVRNEILFTESRESYVDRLEDLRMSGLMPERITHNDTKVNNLLIDNRSHRGICVTDLDTTMPGLVPHDFGDMVRTAANSAAEDEPNLDRVHMDIEIFEPLLEGYLSSAGQFLNAEEMEQLVFACKVIVLETGMRFLTDYLEGDIYFKTKRKSHNLERCRVQFKLLASIEEQEESMEQIVESLSGH